MTRDQAIERAASWWYKMIKDGVWDNGDAVTEAARAGFRSGIAEPTEQQYQQIEKGLVTMVHQQVDVQEARISEYRSDTKVRGSTLYADYGYGPLDDMYAALDLPLISSFFCPQQAGTKILCDETGDYSVEAKNGYGAIWRTI